MTISESVKPLYIDPLPHYTRRMLQALDGYWLHCDGLPKGRHPCSLSDAEIWWYRFEKYRKLVEGQLSGRSSDASRATGGLTSRHCFRHNGRTGRAG